LVLKESHGKKRIRLNDDQRRRLAVKGKTLGPKVLGEIATIVTPDTIPRWRTRRWPIECHERLGGLLHYYYRDAA
jgi:hypothetical protein